MKEYISRIRENCKTWEIIVWWVFRGLMIYALIASIIGPQIASQQDFPNKTQNATDRGATANGCYCRM